METEKPSYCNNCTESLKQHYKDGDFFCSGTSDTDVVFCSYKNRHGGMPNKIFYEHSQVISSAVLLLKSTTKWSMQWLTKHRKITKSRKFLFSLIISIYSVYYILIPMLKRKNIRNSAVIFLSMFTTCRILNSTICLKNCCKTNGVFITKTNDKALCTGINLFTTTRTPYDVITLCQEKLIVGKPEFRTSSYAPDEAIYSAILLLSTIRKTSFSAIILTYYSVYLLKKLDITKNPYKIFRDPYATANNL
jgi:hypothetical protein